MTTNTSFDDDELWQRFHDAVNMTSRELIDWLGVKVELDAGQPGPDEPAPLGQAVVQILGKRKTDLTGDDIAAMNEVLEIVEAETGGMSKDEIMADERRRHRLMTVGHDPARVP